MLSKSRVTNIQSVLFRLIERCKLCLTTAARETKTIIVVMIEQQSLVGRFRTMLITYMDTYMHTNIWIDRVKLLRV